MAEFYLTQTGEEVQEELNQVMPNKDDIATEVQARIDGDAAVTQHCDEAVAAENERATGVEENLQQHCDAAVAAENERALGVEASLQQQINEIVGGDATVSLTANPQTIFVGQQYNIALTASTNKNATSIIIKKAGTQIASGSGQSLPHTDTVTADATGNISYSAEFIISGVTRSANRNITAVLPLYYGVGTSYPETMTKDNTPRVAGSFNYANVTTADGDHLYFEVPNNMKLTSLELVSTYNTPLSFESVASQREGYKAYKNTEPRGAGTYTYRLTIANN